MVQRFGDKHLGGDFFQTLRFEGEIRDCEVQGEIPGDLRGTFYRLGGDWAYAPKYPQDVPFSADGYISMFRFADGRAHYKGRFVETPRYLANQKAGKQLFGLYRNRGGDDPSVRGLSSTVSNTTPVVHAGKLFATKEDARPYEIDPHTLATRGEYTFGGRLSSLTFTAHPKIDPATGEMIAFGYEATGEASTDIMIYFIDKRGQVTREVRLQAPYVSENHDMAISPTHIVIPHFPLTTTKEWLDSSPANLHWYWDERLPGYLLSRSAALSSAARITATDGLRTLDALATAQTSRAWAVPGSSRTATRRSPAASVSLGRAAIPMPRATRLRIVESPSNSHGAGGMPPAPTSSRSTACRDGSPIGAASQGSSRNSSRSTGFAGSANGWPRGSTSTKGSRSSR